MGLICMHVQSQCCIIILFMFGYVFCIVLFYVLCNLMSRYFGYWNNKLTYFVAYLFRCHLQEKGGTRPPIYFLRYIHNESPKI